MSERLPFLGIRYLGKKTPARQAMETYGPSLLHQLIAAQVARKSPDVQALPWAVRESLPDLMGGQSARDAYVYEFPRNENAEGRFRPFSRALGVQALVENLILESSRKGQLDERRQIMDHEMSHAASPLKAIAANFAGDTKTRSAMEKSDWVMSGVKHDSAPLEQIAMLTTAKRWFFRKNGRPPTTLKELDSAIDATHGSNEANRLKSIRHRLELSNMLVSNQRGKGGLA